MFQAINQFPETREDLESQAKRLLKDADVLGLLPTPLDVLAKAAKIECYKSLPETEGFLASLSAAGKKTFLDAMQKVRGIADLRERVIYVPSGQSMAKERFTQAHEISHQITPWHNLDPTMLDTDETLKADVNAEFEREANFCAAELLFQGENFRRIARDYAANIDTALTLADMHETSYQATLWKLAQVQDERICIAQYYPSRQEGSITGFRRWKCVGSHSFISRYSDIDLPNNIDSSHDWFAACDSRFPVNGNCVLKCGEHDTYFEWSAWFNSYTLFVLLRRKPLLTGVGSIVRTRDRKTPSGIILPR